MQRLLHSLHPMRIAGLILLLVSFSSAFAQGTNGRISGRVVDPSGATVPGASVTAKSEDTAATRTTTTDERGYYNFTNLSLGVWEITTQASGFANRTQRVEVTQDEATTITTNLSVAPVSGETNIIEGSGGVRVELQSQPLSTMISGRQIRELPTVTRDPFDLVSLSGNVIGVNQRNGVNTGGASTTTSRAISYAINGQSPTGNNLNLDGGELPDAFQTQFGQQLPLEAVQEIQIITNNYMPRNGRAIGGIINIATRQGGNNWNGSLFEFHRNDALSTNSFENKAFGIPKGQLVSNQFGYGIGGPITQDRLFFFSSTEGILTRSREDRLALVPSAALLGASAGATQTFFNAFPLGATTPAGTLTAGDVRTLVGIPATATGPFATLPAGFPTLNLVRFNTNTDMGAGLPQDSFLTAGRLDWNPTDRGQLYLRYALEHRDLYRGSYSLSPFSGFDAGARQRNHAGIINYSNALWNTWNYNTRVSFNRYNLIRDLGTNPAVPRLLLTNGGGSIGGLPVGLPGFRSLDSLWDFNFSGPSNVLNIAQDFNASWMTHQFTFGGAYFYIQDSRTLGLFQNGTAVLGPNLPTALNNLLLGRTSAFLTGFNFGSALPGGAVTLPVSAPNFNSATREHDFALYFNDNWRATSRLNFNIGLRYDYFGRPRSRNSVIPAGFVLGTGTSPFEQVATGTVVSETNGDNGILFDPDNYNIAPRVGFAWDLLGNSRAALRGGYGISYQRPSSDPRFTLIQTLQRQAGIATFQSPAGGLTTIPLTTNNFGPLGGTTGTLTPSVIAAGFQRNEFETARTHQWNLSLEAQALPNTVFALHYTGAAGRNLYSLANLNGLGSGAAFLGAASPTASLNPAFGPVLLFGNEGRSNYHAMIAEIENSTWRSIGLQFTARYRWSRANSNQGSFLANGLSDFANPFDPGQDYGPADYDVRHRFISSFNWEVPIERFGSGSNAGKLIFGGWQLAGIFHIRSGLPFSLVNCAGAASPLSPCPRIRVSGDIDRKGVDDDSPIATLPNRYAFLNTGNIIAAPFINPATGSSDFGPFPGNTIGRNFFSGPTFWNIDGAVHKRFAVSEGVGLQFRAEFYNLFNTSNLFVPGTVDIGSTSFVPAFRSGRRHIQLALKLTF